MNIHVVKENMSIIKVLKRKKVKYSLYIYLYNEIYIVFVIIVEIIRISKQLNINFC